MAHEARLRADTDEKKLEADKAMHLVSQRVAAQSADNIWARIMRALFALPFAIYIGKLVLWDKVLGLGATDNLSPELWNIAWTVIGFYFLDNTLRRIRG